MMQKNTQTMRTKTTVSSFRDPRDCTSYKFQQKSKRCRPGSQELKIMKTSSRGSLESYSKRDRFRCLRKCRMRTNHSLLLLLAPRILERQCRSRAYPLWTCPREPNPVIRHPWVGRSSDQDSDLRPPTLHPLQRHP